MGECCLTFYSHRPIQTNNLIFKLRIGASKPKSAYWSVGLQNKRQELSYVLLSFYAEICHVSCFMCHASCVMCHVMHHVSCVMRHVSCAMCHVSRVLHHASCVMVWVSKMFAWLCFGDLAPLCKTKYVLVIVCFYFEHNYANCN